MSQIGSNLGVLFQFSTMRIPVNFFRMPAKFLVLILIAQFVFNGALAQSGDGPFKPFSDDDDDVLFGGTRTILNESEDPDWKFEDDLSSSSSSSSSSTVSPLVEVVEKVNNIDVSRDAGVSNGTDVTNGSGVTDSTAEAEIEDDMATGSIILVTLAVVVVFLVLCIWRIVRARRARNRRRNLRNHAMNSSLNGEKSKPEARELLTMNGSSKISDNDVEASEKSKEALLLPATFATTVTVEQMDSLTRRLQPPPPSYEESMRSSETINSPSTDGTFESLGPSYR